MRKIFRCPLCGQIHRHTEFDYDPLQHKDPSELSTSGFIDYVLFYGLSDAEAASLTNYQRTMLNML